MKLTRKILNEHGIHNSFGIAQKAGNKLFIGYSPAIHGRASTSAKWQVHGMGFATDTKAHWADYGSKTFDIWGRDEILPQLNAAIKWVKETYNIDITDKDPFGAYHPKGTLGKLEALIKADKE
jgi:hypothetical protein